MTEWRECKLGDVITFQRGYDLPKDKMVRGIYPVVASNGIIGFHNEYTTENPCVTIGRSGNVGNPNIVYSRAWAHNTTLYIREYKNCDPVFIYYMLHTLDLGRYASGSAVPTLNRNHIHSILISMPPLPEQKAIAEVLSSLDDKIDLLTRQNKTLEDLAQAYFRKWFIEDASDKWEEKGLDEIADFLNGLPLQKYPYKTGNPLHVIKIKELNNGFTDSSDLCSADIPEQYIVHPGDVIFSWSGSLKVDIWKYGKGALNQHLFKVTSCNYPKWFYYFWIKYHLPEFKMIAESKATTMGHIQRRDLSNAIVLVPENQEINNMDNIMSPLIKKIEQNNAQILVLQKLRDTLLPKLISGEIRVKM
jgi:Type I restriction modification DNA specificity domain.